MNVASGERLGFLPERLRSVFTDVTTADVDQGGSQVRIDVLCHTDDPHVAAGAPCLSDSRLDVLDDARPIPGQQLAIVWINHRRATRYRRPSPARRYYRLRDQNDRQKSLRSSACRAPFDTAAPPTT